MKKNFFGAMLLTILCLSWQAFTPASPVQSQQDNAAAEISFDTLIHSFGRFSEKDPVVRCAFKFANTGTAPLIIHQALASCGCTVPDYPKDPIAPGDSGVINVTYNGQGKFPGTFKKSITIRSNAKNDVVRLYIEGDMYSAAHP